MTLEQFRRTLAKSGPPAEMSAPLASLWWAAKGDWERAHGIVMDAGGKEAAWVHAYLHRVEGDLANARYWYGQAGRKAPNAPLATEWEDIARSLL